MPNFFCFANAGFDWQQITPGLRIRKHRSFKTGCPDSSQNPNRPKSAPPRLQKLNPRRNIQRQGNKMPSTLARVFPKGGSESERVHNFTITYYCNKLTIGKFRKPTEKIRGNPKQLNLKRPSAIWMTSTLL
jgi:hypothetical protein